MGQLLAAWVAAAFLAVAARAAAAADAGYVVKADSAAVYLDFNSASGAVAGQAFEIYAEGEELRHPATGKLLGRAETIVARGTLRQILPLMSIGTLAPSAGKVSKGMRARLTPAGPAPGAAAAAAAPSGGRAPRWKSPVFDYKITGIAVADFEGTGSLQVALSDARGVRIYAYPPQEAKPLAEFNHRGNAPRILSLEAGDLDGDGKAELFATLYNGFFERAETVVLGLSPAAEGGTRALKELADIPWIVRGHHDAEGRRLLAVQQLVEDATFPFSGIYPLVLKDGRYGPGPKALRHKPADWIYGFTTAKLDGGAPALLYLLNNDRLRIQFEKGHWRSPEAYAQTPSRVRWQGRLLEFHPRMEVAYDAQGKASVYLPRNLSMLGSLSEPFGLFRGAEIRRASWNGIALEEDWKAELGGYCPALTLVGEAQAPRELAVAVVGAAGKSTLWIYDP